jgi:hypothetical protein
MYSYRSTVQLYVVLVERLYYLMVLVVLLDLVPYRTVVLKVVLAFQQERPSRRCQYYSCIQPHFTSKVPVIPTTSKATGTRS